eukprot:TRINITY_DN1830_c0_g1_i3.p2 TRINITY_DN1830_c0_g1~~TRINITY_DN1830_c0_g1_i3.p2  ORF type:complete len:120 (-),score=41.89 TRINITY_DN1830_c0_g1_i3:5-364(-)
MGLVQGEGVALSSQIKSLDSATSLMLILSAFLGFLMSITYFSLNKISTATSISLAGNMNKFVSVIVGSFVFQQALTLQTTVGLIICLFGGFYYSVEGVKAKEARKGGSDEKEDEEKDTV